MATVLHGDFEWDDVKAENNLRRHAVSLLEGITVFDDPFAIIERSHKHSIGEIRYVIIGMSERNRLIAVAYTIREQVRIISARKLTPQERRHYEKQTENQ